MASPSPTILSPFYLGSLFEAGRSPATASMVVAAVRAQYRLSREPYPCLSARALAIPVLEGPRSDVAYSWTVGRSAVRPRAAPCTSPLGHVGT